MNKRRAVITSKNPLPDAFFDGFLAFFAQNSPENCKNWQLSCKQNADGFVSVISHKGEEEHPEALFADYDDPFSAVGCVILASGSAKRFGSDKLLASFLGKPVIEGVLSATQFFKNRVAVTRSEKIAEYCNLQGVCTLLHAFPNKNDTVRLGLEQFQSTAVCGFFPADQPLLSAETAQTLALCALNAPQFIFRPESGGVVSSPVFFPAWAYAELLTLPKSTGGSFVLKKYPERIRTVNVRDASELKDIDYPADLIFLTEQ